MTRQLLIFDLDGTLADTRRDLAAGINRMRAHYGLPPLPLATVTAHVGDGVRTLVSRCLPDAPPRIDLDEAVRLNIAAYRQHLVDDTTLYPGVPEGLRALAAAGHVLALLTNKPEPAARAILRHFAIEPFFVRVIGGDSGLPLKPDPAAIVALQGAAGAAAADTWMIGDNHTDMAAAHRAGVHSIFVAYGFGTPDADPPERTAGRFDDVAALFLQA